MTFNTWYLKKLPSRGPPRAPRSSTSLHRRPGATSAWVTAAATAKGLRQLPRTESSRKEELIVPRHSGIPPSAAGADHGRGAYGLRLPARRLNVTRAECRRQLGAEAANEGSACGALAGGCNAGRRRPLCISCHPLPRPPHNKGKVVTSPLKGLPRLAKLASLLEEV